MLKQCNPGTLTNIKTYSQDLFKYGFMAFGVYLQGFNHVISPVIAIDAAYLIGSVSGVLLIASPKDRDSQIYPLAFGFAASECIISALKKVYLAAHHAFCVFHIAQKFKRSSKSRCMARQFFYQACSKYLREECDIDLQQMAACNQRYYNDVMDIGVDKFTRANCPKNRYQMMSTQLAESMNSALLDLRKLPIASLAVLIRDMMQKWFHNRRTIANRLSSDLTLEADKHIHERVDSSYKCIVHPLLYHSYNITKKQNNFIIDCQAKTCACREWDLKKLPYRHALDCANFSCSFSSFVTKKGRHRCVRSTQVCDHPLTTCKNVWAAASQGQRYNWT
ncbi:hypothetical protein Dsin_005326 [Dipteronia sinensis]|uniref:Zinc finger PMZ-type domain-containing protein n=1 Tax=Dipteronia sinensis TaxID=43782 RepID=A0AAE0AXK1_9ROSI|nr:hypothetical protein Dsin_005326 [Dipteronia sinensis]